MYRTVETLTPFVAIALGIFCTFTLQWPFMLAVTFVALLLYPIAHAPFVHCSYGAATVWGMIWFLVGLWIIGSIIYFFVH